MKLHLTGDAFQMIATNEQGNEIRLDASEDIGGQNFGMRPMQLLLAAVGGCSAIDVLLILRKQRHTIDSFDVSIDGVREQLEDHSLWREITLHFTVGGTADHNAVEKAVKLSLDKYCSVAKTLEPTAQIHYRITVVPAVA